MTTEQFIRQLFLNEMEKIVYTHRHHYLSFGLVSQGIEFLGACLDDKHEFIYDGKDTREYAGKRFRNAIEILFPKNYRPYAIKGKEHDLYDNLRNGMTHMVTPKPYVGLTHRQEAKHFGTEHLKLYDTVDGNGKTYKQLILIAEDYYNDFETACFTIIDKITKQEFQHPKMYREHLRTPKY